MAEIEARLRARGLTLPPVVRPPQGVVLPFRQVLISGGAFVSGHGPQNRDGTLAGPFGKVGREVSVEQGYAAARLTTLAIDARQQR